MKAYTKGPWAVSQQNGLTLYIVGNDEAIAEVLRANFNKETFANANLIAAAPELLDLLERAVKVFNWVELPSPNTEETWNKFVAACEAAIHKAEGV